MANANIFVLLSMSKHKNKLTIGETLCALQVLQLRKKYDVNTELTISLNELCSELKEYEVREISLTLNLMYKDHLISAIKIDNKSYIQY